MYRRRFFLAGASGLASLCLAGCTDDEATEETTTATTTQRTATTSVEQIRAAAADHLSDAKASLNEESDTIGEASIEEGGVDVATDRIREDLDAADADLERIASRTDEPGGELEAAQAWTAFARSLLPFMDTFAEGYTELSVGMSYFESERWADAAESIQTAGDRFSDADDEFQVVRDRSEAVSETPDSFEGVELTTSDADIETLDETLGLMKPFADGFRQIALGMVDFEDATAEFETERFSAAETTYGDAEQHFGDAELTYRDLEESAPATLRSDIVDLTCVASSMKDATAHMGTAAAASEQGDQSRAEAAASDAETALDRCSSSDG